MASEYSLALDFGCATKVSARYIGTRVLLPF